MRAQLFFQDLTFFYRPNEYVNAARGVTFCRKPLLSNRNRTFPVSKMLLNRLYLNPAEPLLKTTLSFPPDMVGRNCVPETPGMLSVGLVVRKTRGASWRACPR